MKTRIDQLLSNLTMRHEVRCNILPKVLPKEVQVKALPSTAAWRYVLLCENDRVMELVVAALKRERRNYSLDTFQRKAWWVKWIAPKGQSFTYNLVWRLGLAGGGMWGVLSLAGRLGFRG